MPEGIHSRLFFLRRAIRHYSFAFTDVVVRMLLQTHAVLHLRYIERSNLKSILLFDVGLDVIVGAFLRYYLLFLPDIEAIQINLD